MSSFGQRSKKVPADLFLNRFTIHDKSNPMFRAKRAAEYFLQIEAVITKYNVRVVIREFVFATKAEQTQHYKMLRRTLGMDPK